MIDDIDRAELWRESTQKAKKQHKCAECGRYIKPGEYLVSKAGMKAVYPEEQ